MPDFLAPKKPPAPATAPAPAVKATSSAAPAPLVDSSAPATAVEPSTAPAPAVDQGAAAPAAVPSTMTITTTALIVAPPQLAPAPATVPAPAPATVTAAPCPCMGQTPCACGCGCPTCGCPTCGCAQQPCPCSASLATTTAVIAPVPAPAPAVVTTTTTTTTGTTTTSGPTTTWIIPNGKRCEASAIADCKGHATCYSWEASCMSKSQFCDGCNECVAMDTVPCPKDWLSFQGKCYRVNQKTDDYYGARRWCEDQNATLVSIRSAEENQFLWRICHAETDPITYARSDTRTSCWLGMREKPNTGNKSSPQEAQLWEFLDGSTPRGNNYSNWASRPGMGDGQGDGNRFSEPNNERTRYSPIGMDVRHAIMNQIEGGMNGKWYDKPAQFRAHAACEKLGETRR